MMNYIWLILLAIYIISPVDAHPMAIDDIIALGAFIYYMYKNSKQRKKQQDYSYFGNSDQSDNKTTTGSQGPLTLDDAYSLLGINRSASLEDINKAYKHKMIKSHPDKVSHMNEELQDKAKEITLKLNEALDLIKKHKKL